MNYHLTDANGRNVLSTFTATSLRAAISMVAQETGATIISNFLHDESMEVLVLTKNGKTNKACLSCKVPVYDLDIVEAEFFGHSEEMSSETTTRLEE